MTALNAGYFTFLAQEKFSIGIEQGTIMFVTDVALSWGCKKTTFPLLLEK